MKIERDSLNSRVYVAKKRAFLSMHLPGIQYDDNFQHQNKLEKFFIV